MEERMMNCLNRIEGHLAIIAEAASAKMKRASSRQRTVQKLREFNPETDFPKLEHIELAKKLGCNIAVEWPKFKSNALKFRKKFADWDQALSGWLRNVETFARKP